MARQHSQDGSAPNGGELGWVHFQSFGCDAIQPQRDIAQRRIAARAAAKAA